ncbi:hypothetical protein [Lederbergia galactosidilytica]|uniref:Lipoprotein n=2 Tax=Lederbergia galactosidilytica TaxID=217031 RepID=A0A177ZTB2_9BACI|nr:hypothetical protein [Lederbergia galactosidilytica]OAK70769.1 hypothetical protein ABB05_11705 [Lederbergia galactosidilytica]
MLLKKKWLAMLAVMTAILLLGACGGKNAGGGDPLVGGSGPQDGSPDDLMPISEGFEKYPVWVEVYEDPVRDTEIQNIYVFKKGEVTTYNLNEGDIGKSGVVIEDILGMSDDELIKFASKTSNKQYDDYEKEMKDRKFFNVESFNETKESLYIGLEDYYGEDYRGAYDAYLKDQKTMMEDINFSIEGEWSTQANKYTLDVKIDDLGQSTEGLDLIIPNAISKLDTGFISTTFGDYLDYLYFNTDAIFMETGNEERAKTLEQNYIEPLKNEGRFVEKDGFELMHPQNFVPNPFVWKKEEKILSFDSATMNRKIFETTFSGIKKGNGGLFTRTDDSFVDFRLDSPDSKKKNVTIEGK